DTRATAAGVDSLRTALPKCKVEWHPSPTVAAAPAVPAATPPVVPVAAPATTPIDPAVERKAAEWTLSVGGKLFVQVRGGTPLEIARVDQLPPPPFTVYAIEIRGNPRVNDPSLTVLHGLNHLERLYLTETAVTDRGMEHVRTQQALATLGISATNVGDAGVEQIADLPRLVQFFANGNPITDRGARSLARSKSIRVVHLNSTRVTDAGLAFLAQIPSLIAAELNNTSVGDVGLRNLQPCISIDHLLLTRTRVTDAGLGFLAGMSRLRHLELRADNITDRGVEKLAALKSLQDLAITETHISQAGYEKLQAALPGCKIEWSMAAPGAVASTTPATVVPLDTSNRLPVPSSADQQKALATLKDVFKDDFSAAKKAEDKAALAEKLLKQAQDSRDDPASVYVMLGEARNLAGDAADAALTVRLISELGNRFQVDPLELLAEDLERATQKSHPSAAFKAIAEAALEHVDEALDADQFPLAKRLSDVALAAARKAKDPTKLKTAIERNKGLATLKQQWDAAEEARTMLAKTPDDPEANLALGRYLCFVRSDWAEGLKHLARGGDTTLKELAAKSAADPQDAAGQAELGEAWAQAADAARGKSKPELQAGARYWYAKAQPALSGLAKAKADQRLKQLGSATTTAGSSISTGRVGRRAQGNVMEQLARDRKAAEWVLGLRGKVGIMAPWLPEQKMIDLASNLPPQPFALTKIDLFKIEQLTDQDLENLEGLANLRELRLEATPLGDAGLEHIKDLTNLTSLNIGTTRITDAGLENIRGLKNLQELWLGNRPPITDAGLEQLKDMANLRFLNLGNTRVTDAGLTLLKNFPRLQILQLNITPVTDAGLDRLQSMPQLTELDLSQT
ncbi:MAG TPA: hypothetical protein VHY20_01875, partial [Pirellulales bacterium]|nr:hypothetical protein [Pirellulales bacterium]